MVLSGTPVACVATAVTMTTMVGRSDRQELVAQVPPWKVLDQKEQ